MAGCQSHTPPQNLSCRGPNLYNAIGLCLGKWPSEFERSIIFFCEHIDRNGYTAVTLLSHLDKGLPLNMTWRWRKPFSQWHQSVLHWRHFGTASEIISNLTLLRQIANYSDVIMGTMASQITSPTSVYSTVYSGADQRKYQSSPSLAFVRGIHRWPVNSPHKWPVTRKMFPFDDVIMFQPNASKRITLTSHWHGAWNHQQIDAQLHQIVRNY